MEDVHSLNVTLYTILDGSNSNNWRPLCDLFNPWRNRSCITPIPLHKYDIHVTLNGLFSPIITVATLVTNLLVCVVLLKRSMRNPTSILLVAMAASDMLTSLFPLPFSVYFYSLGNYLSLEYVPYRLCYAYRMCTDRLPTLFHTASIWLSVALSIQRYLFVCQSHSRRASSLCATANSIKAIVIIYAVAIAYQTGRFFDSEYYPIKSVSASSGETGPAPIGCQSRLVSIVGNNRQVYFNLYYWFRIIFIEIIPCVMMVIFNAILIQAMRQAQHRRRRLLQQHRRLESRCLSESNATTMMLVTVVSLSVMVEIPQAVLLTLLTLDNSFGLTLLSQVAMLTVYPIINTLITLMYPVNFFIYCGMSRKFREEFVSLFSRRGPTLPVASTAQMVTVNSTTAAAAPQVGCRLSRHVL